VGPVVASSIAGFLQISPRQRNAEKNSKKTGSIPDFIKPEGSASALVGKSFVLYG